MRTAAADDLWLSMAYGQDIVCLHFSWFFEPEEVARIVPIVQEALAPFEPRPHWGKVNTLPGAEVNARYPKHADFVELAGRLESNRQVPECLPGADGVRGVARRPSPRRVRVKVKVKVKVGWRWVTCLPDPTPRLSPAGGRKGTRPSPTRPNP
ncbi:MAG: D-arabinono-1,4-lactone oxidase [Thermomicrobiales bacterium]